MRILLQVVGFAVLLTGCEGMYQGDDIQSIRSQRQADAYNATVSSESEKLVCTRERVTGSNLPRFVCLTVAQRDRMARSAQDTIEQIRSAGVVN
jgi:hypothetical protein